ncbi:MAG: hypothetical protein V1934_03230 [Methanobacteriota archaeon]
MDNKVRKRIIILLGTILIISLIILAYYFPFFGYWRIESGMTETTVKNIMGTPDFINGFTIGEPFFGPRPDLPNGTYFISWTYHVRDQIIGITFISSLDYDNITGYHISTTDYVVFEKHNHSDSIVY